MDKSVKRKIINIIVVFLIILMLFLIIMPSPYKPTNQACNEAKQLTEYVTSNYSFPRESIFDSKSAPVSWIAGRNICFFKESHVINICYITEPEEQKKIIAIIEDYKKEKQIRDVVINFYEKEYKRIRPVEHGEVISSGVEGLLLKAKIK